MIDVDPVAVAAIIAGAAAGVGAAAMHARRAAERAARRTLALLRTEQAADDRDALASLPPGLLSADVWAHAGRTGMSLREAADDLFVAQVTARLNANIKLHHGRPRKAGR